MVWRFGGRTTIRLASGFEIKKIGTFGGRKTIMLALLGIEQLERTTSITGLSFGRTDLSIGGSGATFHALSHRHGPVGPSFQGMPEKFDFMIYVDLCLNVFYENR